MRLIFSKFPSEFKFNGNLFLIIPTFFFVFLFVQVSFAQEYEADAKDEAAQAEAVAKFNQGQDAHEKGDFQTALKFYDEAIKLAPDFPEVEFQRGNAFLSLNRSADAEKAFRRAVELREDWSLPMANLGGLLVSRNSFAEAETILTKAVALDAKNFPAYAALTELRLKTKSAPSVLRELLTKIKSLTAKANPPASLWAAQGAIESVLGDLPSAKKSLGNALTIEPRNNFALRSLIDVAAAEGDYVKALKDAQTLIQIAPDAIDSKVLLARLYAESGETEAAEKILNALDASNANVFALRAAINQGSSTNVAALESESVKDTKNPQILGRLCALLRVENPPKALDYCRRASEIEPNNLNHVVGFGAALVQAKQYDNAVALLKKLLTLAPDNYTAHANLATALFQLKRYAEAISEYEWITGKQPKLAIGYYFLAISHDNLEQYTDAMANYQQFLKTADPNDNKLEIEKVDLRLPTLEKLIKKTGKKK